jgi:hypothetical protein
MAGHMGAIVPCPAQDGVFPEIALRILRTLQLYSDNIAHTLATYL